MRLVLRTRPSPPQVPQGVVRSPVPWHSPQSCTCWNTPSGVRTAVATCPAPPQALQVEGLVPALAPLPSHVPHSVILSTFAHRRQMVYLLILVFVDTSYAFSPRHKLVRTSYPWYHR